MKAIIINQYGNSDVLKYVDLEKPEITSEQILIKVHCSSVNPIDWKIRKGMVKVLTGNKFPMQLGFDVAGEVVEVGKEVTNFKLGDAVYAYLDKIPGGAYAEYVAVSAKVVCLKPSNMSYQEAAAAPLAATTALQALRDKGNIQPGKKVLINGASGGVGTFAVQIAKAGEAEVTAVCSEKNVELVQSLGADKVINYQQQDFTQDTAKYDIIFDVVSKRSFTKCKNNLLSQGVYLTLLPNSGVFLQSFLTSLTRGKQAKFILMVKPSSSDLNYLKDLIEAGKLRTIVDRSYPLADIAQAHIYSEQEHTVGKIVIQI